VSLIPSEFINGLITRADIVDIIHQRISLKKAGRNYQACCPFHEEKTPSFSVSPQKQFFYCFGCGAGGNVISFIMAYERVEFVDAVEMLAQLLGLEVPRDATGKSSSQKSTASNDLFTRLSKKSEYYQQQLKSSQSAKDYLTSREISENMIEKFHIGYCPDDHHHSQDSFKGRIIFPIHDRRGRVIGFGGRVLQDGRMPKYLNSSDSTIFHKGNILYGLYQVREAYREVEKILIVEGYMDVVSLCERGIDFAVATLGTATTSQHVSQLLQQTSLLIFCFDGDKAGRKAAWRALESVLSVMRDDAEIRFLFLPEGEDPDSLVKKEGKIDFLKRFESSQALADFFFGYLKTQSNTNTLEGRSKFAKLAMPYLEKIPGGVYREMMLDKLAELVRLEKSRLSQVSQTQDNPPVKSGIKIQRTPMRLAVSLFLQNPHMLSVISSEMQMHISNWTFQGSELLKEIISLVKLHPQFTTANILEYFRDKSESGLLNKLAVWEHGVPNEGIVNEWQDILKAFHKKERENHIENLLAKSGLNLLNQNEKIELQRLLSEK
jgi:DNA primase